MKLTACQVLIVILMAFCLGGFLGVDKSTPPLGVTRHVPTPVPTSPFKPPPELNDFPTPVATETVAENPPTVSEVATRSSRPAQPPEPTGKYTALEHSTRSRPVWVPHFSEYFDPKNERVPKESLDPRDLKDGYSGVQRGAAPYPSFNNERLAVQQDIPMHRSVCKGNWRLPPNQTRFCRSYDGIPALGMSRLRRLDVPDRSKLLCDADSPLSITRCSTEECRMASGCLLALPSAHCRFPSVIVPFAHPSHMDGGMEASASKIFHDPLSETEMALGMYHGYPVARIQQCADVAMQSYCDHAFQLIPERHAVCSFRGSATSENAQNCHNRSRMLKCVAFRYHHYSRGSLQPLPSQPLFAFLHRSEWRPSLLRDDLRLAVLQGPDTTFRANSNGYQTPLVKIGVRGAFGEISPLGIRMHIVVTLFVSECMGAAGAGNRTVLAQQARDWVSPASGTPASVSPARAEVEFNVGNLNFRPWIGCKLSLRAVGEAQELASGAELPPVVKEVHSMLQYDSEAVVLAHELESGEAATRRGEQSCAPYLRADECCLNGMTAFHVGGGADGAPLSRAAFAGKWQETAVYLRITASAGGNEHPCISIVDGHLTSFEFHGVAVFPWLVVRNRCTPQEMASYSLTADTSAVPFELRKVQGNVYIPNASVALPLRVFADCGRAGVIDEEPLGGASSSLLYNGVPVKLLVSLAVHEHLDVVAQQLTNIAVFAPTSVVVLHIAPTWNVDMSTILLLNGTAHPHVEINPNRHIYSKQKLAQVQLSGARYVAEALPWVPWTHVILFASNELFVRAGVEEHLQQYDLAFPGRPRPRQAISVLHSFFGGRPEMRFSDPEYLNRGFHYWGQNKGDGGLHGEFALNRMLQLLGLQTYSTHQLYSEGTFYNRTIAVRLSGVLDTLFDEADGDCLDTWMSVSEAFLLQIVQNACGQRRSPTVAQRGEIHVDPQLVPRSWNASEAKQLMLELEDARCGDKTGSVSWLGHIWFTNKRDVFAARCSPFEGPFSFKRFERDTNNPVRIEVDTIQSNITLAKQKREWLDTGRCNQLQWHQ
jgi:hypothetical protein